VNYDVIGIGNAIVDVLVQTEDAFLTAHALEKGGMTLVEGERSAELYAARCATTNWVTSSGTTSARRGCTSKRRR
jgi:hypothetical protein